MHRVTNNQAADRADEAAAHMAMERVRQRIAGIMQPLQANALEKLADDFPAAVIQTAKLDDFESVAELFAAQPIQPRITISRELAAALTRDAHLYDTLRAEADGLLNLGGGSKLLRLGAARVVRGITADGTSLGYVETHLTEDNIVLAVARLSLDNGLAMPGRLFRKLAGFADADAAPWRFETMVKPDAAEARQRQEGKLGNAFIADALPDSDLFVLLASKFLGKMEPLVLDLGGGVNLRPTLNGVLFEISGDTVAEADAGDAERFMTLGGGGNSSNLWISGDAG